VATFSTASDSAMIVTCLMHECTNALKYSIIGVYVSEAKVTLKMQSILVPPRD